MSALDLLLVIPHQPDSARILSGSTGITPPLGVGYIASWVRAGGFSVKILDNSIERLSPSAFAAFVAREKPFAVGLSICTSAHNTSAELAALVKGVGADIHVIAGGVHPSALPREILKNRDFDFAVKGEGEETIAELLSALRGKNPLSEVKGIFYRDASGAVVETADRPFFASLDDIPFPAYDLMPMGRYTLPASRRLTDKPVGAIVTSRGCPYKCAFCSHNSVFRGGVRFRSPGNVIGEIKLLVEKHGVGEILIWDDSFLMRKPRALEICSLIRRECPGLLWTCSSRVDHMDEELAAALYSAGCREVLFGVESGSQKVLDSIEKKTTLEQARRAVTACRRHGLLSFCSFILGTPEETEATARETLAFALDLDPDFAIFCIFAPMPGSAFFDRLTAEGRFSVENADWDRYINLMSSELPLISAGELGREELVRLQKEFFRRFYFRPSYVWKRLKMLRSRQHLYQQWRGLKSLLQLQLSRIGGGK